jgi:hypothetical protein
MMEKSKFTNQLISFLEHTESLTDKKIKNFDDVSRLLEIIFKDGLENILETLAFNSKYLHGLFKIVQTNDENISPDYFGKVTKEYSEYTQKVKDNLELILAGATDFYREIFREKYFTLTRESLENLNDLCNDFAQIKLFLNEKKREECS